MLPFKGVILDMDGVMVDSVPFIVEASVRAFAELGHLVRRDDFVPFLGTGEAGLLGGVAAKYGIALDVGPVKARAYALYFELIRGRLRALPGLHAFLAECRRLNLRLAVASSADAVKVEGNLREIGLARDTFDAVVDGDMVARRKPAPDLFLAAADRIGLAARDCLVVEDAAAGVAAARAADSRCLALTTSLPADRLGDADWVAADLANVPREVWDRLSGNERH